MNKAVLLQLQQAKAKAAQELEMRNNMRHVYDNISYEDNETRHDPDSYSTKAPRDASSPSQTFGDKEEKEVKIDRF